MGKKTINPKDFVGKKPVGFLLNNSFVEAESFTDLTLKTLKELYQLDESILLDLAGKNFRFKGKSPLISFADWDMNRGAKIPETDIFVEMHHSTVSILTFLNAVIEKYDQVNCYEIKVK